ncbi:MAG: hypothetical protein O3A29_05335 [Planctomycetota bacterium]|nr:hypothetical protein [Planctomycetota bacterium]
MSNLMLSFTVLLTLCTVAQSGEPEYSWEQITLNAPFKPRDGGGAIVFDGKMWLLGGWNPRDKEFFPRICNNEVWSSTDGLDWRLVKPNTFKDDSFDSTTDWEGRHYAGYVVHRDKMWIVGGDVNQGHYHFDVWNSTNGKTWSHVNKDRPIPWKPRAFGYTAAFDDRIWVLGGQTIPQIAPAEPLFHRDIWTTTDGIEWKEIKPQEPCWEARALIGGQAVFKDRLWLIGGGLYDTPGTERTFHNDVWSTADGVHWKKHLAEAPWSKRQMHELAVWDDKLWVLEGWNETNRNDVWYSTDGVEWTELKNTPWKPRHAASVYVHDGSLWMVAGNNMEPDVWRLRKSE